jgi:hypothetical protein
MRIIQWVHDPLRDPICLFSHSKVIFRNVDLGDFIQDKPFILLVSCDHLLTIGDSHNVHDGFDLCDLCDIVTFFTFFNFLSFYNTLQSLWVRSSMKKRHGFPYYLCHHRHSGHGAA